MIPNIRFKLKDPKTNGESLIIMVFYMSKRRFVFSTGRKIFPVLWDFNMERPIDARKAKDVSDRNRINYQLNKYNSVNPSLKIDLQNTSTRLDNLVGELKRYFSQCENQNINIDLKDLKRHLKAKFITESYINVIEESEDIKFYILDIIKDFVKAITNGTKKTKQGKRFSYSTVKTNRNLISVWSNFEDAMTCHYQLHDISKELFDSFLIHVNTNLYSRNTTKKHLTNFKIMVCEALSDIEDENYSRIKEGKAKILSNEDISRIERLLKKYFSVSEVQTTEVALTEKELDQLFDLDLSGNENEELVRDIFLVGCYIGSRISDYSRLGPEHYKRTINGPRIELRQQKTGKMVAIPVKPELENILKKYNFKLPSTSDQNINRTIKKIAEKAGIIDPIEIIRSKGDHEVISTMPKHKLIKSHTARRTFATILINQGTPYTDVMTLTGHKSIKSFEQYIRLNNIDTIKRLASSAFFKGKKTG